MRHSAHHGGGLHPLALLFLGPPVLLYLGAMKGCEMIESVRSPEPPAVARTAKPPPAPPVISKEKGWKI